MEKFEQELIDAATDYKEELVDCIVKCDDGVDRINTRLLSKEASKYFLIKNVKECAKYDTHFVSDDLDEFVEKIFSMDNVYVSLLPVTNYFNKSGEFIKEIFVRSDRGRLDFQYDDIINKMNYYTDRGAVIYFYVYYGMFCDICDGVNAIKKDVKTYWWRMAHIQDNISKHVDDVTLSWEERYKKLEEHHIEETTFLMKKIHEIRNK